MPARARPLDQQRDQHVHQRDDEGDAVRAREVGHLQEVRQPDDGVRQEDPRHPVADARAGELARDPRGRHEHDAPRRPRPPALEQRDEGAERGEVERAAQLRHDQRLGRGEPSRMAGTEQGRPDRRAGEAVAGDRPGEPSERRATQRRRVADGEEQRHERDEGERCRRRAAAARPSRAAPARAASASARIVGRRGIG